MKTKIFLAGLMAITPFFLIAQVNEESPSGFISARDVYISPGFMVQRQKFASLDDFKILAPESEILKRDYSDFSQQGWRYVSAVSAYAINLGFNFRNKSGGGYRSNPQLRLGLVYFHQDVFSGYAYRGVITPFDTLRSNQTEEVMYIEKAHSSNLSAYFTSDNLRLDASLIFRTAPEERWSIYGGIGFNAGIAFNSAVHLYYSEHESYESTSKGPYGVIYYGGFNYKHLLEESERIALRSTFGASAFIPLGLDFRIGNKSQFWRRMHLYYELRPGMNYLDIPGIGMHVNQTLHHGLGLRVSLRE